MKRWEYHTSHKLEIVLFNKLGNEGWELVSAYSVKYTTGADLTFIFKREIL